MKQYHFLQVFAAILLVLVLPLAASGLTLSTEVPLSVLAFSPATSTGSDVTQQALVQEEKPAAGAPQSVSPARPGIKPPFPPSYPAHCCCCCRARACCKSWGKTSYYGPKLGAGGHHMGEGWGMEEGDRIGRHGHHRGRLPGMRHKGRWGERRDDAGKYVAADRYLRCAAELGLSDDQKSKLKELAFKTKKEMIDLRASVQKARLELKELVRSEDPNLREIKRQLDALAAAQADLRYKRIASMLEAREILTAEQRKRLEEK